MLPKILITRLGAFGDVCMAAPLIRSLGEQADIHWLIRRDYEPVVRPFLGDRCQLHGVVPRRDVHEPFDAAIVARLREEKYAALVDLSHWPMVRSLVRQLQDIPIRAITVDPEQDLRLGLEPAADSPFNLQVPVDPHAHQVDKWRTLFRSALLLEGRIDNWPLPPIRRSDLRLRVFVHPHAGKPSKQWPARNFAAVIRKLATDRPVDCFINTGSKREVAAALQLWLRLLPSRCRVRFSLVDHSFVRLRRLLETVDVAIGSDSGPMHYASLLGVPTAPIFGPYSPFEFGPLYRSRPVEPARAERPAAEVSVDQVFEALRPIVATSSTASLVA